ncbi:MAG: hypothetical protein P8J20_04955 [Novosphingobium sp.]|nr:hypothetical protein [Novosphingobium sp.]
MQHTAEPEVKAERKFIEAIALKRLVVAEYNGSQMHLAPHQLFARHGDLFVSALNTGKSWRSDDERRLGNFKLQGLSNVALTENPFEPLQNYDGQLPRQSDEQIFAISA